MSDAPAAASRAPDAPWDGVPGSREWLYLLVSLAALVAILPPVSLPLYAATFAAVYAIAALGLRRAARVILVLAVLGAFLAVERHLPRPSVPLVLWSGRAIRAFFCFRAIDFVLTRPRRELSARPGDRVVQYLLYVTFLPCIFAGPVVMFNDFYRAYLPASFLARSAAARHLGKIAWGGAKYFLLGPPILRLLEDLYRQAHGAEGAPLGLGPGGLMWGFLLLQLVDAFVRFSGFTDMAIGVARLLGFQLDENFLLPLLASSPMGFWKTWHISAYRWLMTHVFYPSWGHTQVFLKIQTAFLASAAWHLLAITQPIRLGSALQLAGSGVIYGSGVALVAAVARRRGAGGGEPGRPSLALRLLQIAATYLFVSFVHLIFRAGLTGRPLARTWFDLGLLIDPAAFLAGTS